MCCQAAMTSTLQASGFMCIFKKCFHVVLTLSYPVWLLQSGSSGHAGECLQRLGDHHHLPPKQQTAGSGGSLHPADGQCV